jgi:hypothetical protein
VELIFKNSRNSKPHQFVRNCKLNLTTKLGGATMRLVKFFFSLLIPLITIFFFSSLPAQQKTETKKATFKGEVLDLACYIAGEKKGAGHKKCADMCIQGGAPIGILTDDGKVYLIVENHSKPEPYEKLKNYAAEKVTITGVLYQRGGLPGIVIESVEPAK